MRRKHDFDGINRVMRKGRGGIVTSNLRGHFRSMHFSGGGGGGGGGAVAEIEVPEISTLSVNENDDKGTATEKMQRLAAHTRDLTRHSKVTSEQLHKIADDVSKIAQQQKGEIEKLAAEVQQQKEITLRLASTDPAADREKYDRGVFASLAYGREPDSDLLKDLNKSGVSALDPGYFALVTLDDDDAKHRGAPDVLRAQLAEFRMLNDALYIMAKAKAITDPAGFMQSNGARGFKLWHRYETLAKKFQGALAEGGATTGGNWVPTILSSNLTQLIQVMMKLQGFIPTIAMPSLTYDNPVEGADNIAYFIAEGSSITESDFATAKMTHVARKLAARTRTSYELDQDSAISITSEILRKLAKALRRGIEKGIVSGQRSGTIDTGDAPGATDVRSAWDGIRRDFYDMGVAPVDGGGGVTVEQIAKLQGPMGAYGLDPAECFFLCSAWGHAILLCLKDGGNNVVNLTLDKVGGDATWVKGQLGSMLGCPIVVSEFVPDNMTSAGIVDGSGDRTAIYKVNREVYRLGERLGATLDASPHVHFDTHQISFRGVVRLDLQTAFTPSATDRFVNAVGNIALT